MGDVAMTAPVLKHIAEQNPDSSFVFLTRPFFKAFLEDIPNVTVYPFDPQNYKGIVGLYRLYQELRKEQFTAVADLHYNLRSRIISLFFRISGVKIKQLDKGRAEKKALIQHRIHRQLRLTTERYADVFRALNYSVNLSHQLQKRNGNIPKKYEQIFSKENRNIGIAPFAQHSYKIYPIVKMEEVIKQLSYKGYHIFIFGGGKKERTIADNWVNTYDNINNTIGILSIKEELDLIGNLDVMISMDSSGMHMASLAGTRCISLWGATHPYAGFLGYGQSYDDCLQINHPNRPSSIYGNKPCNCDGTEAIDLIPVEMVIDKINQIYS